MVNENIVSLIILFFMLSGFIFLINLYIKFKNIKVIKNNSSLSKEEMQVKIEQIEIVKKISMLTESRIERLVRLSGNPFNLTPAVFSALIYIVPVISFIAFLIAYIAGESSLMILFIIISFLSFWYPQYLYSERIKSRGNSWFKIQQHIFKIEEELNSNDYKKSLINVSQYLKSIGEDELSSGLEHMVDLWPDSDSDIMESLKEFEKLYPFDIPKDLFNLLVNSERSGLSASKRLKTFKGTIIMKYQKYAEGVLNKIPSTATVASLPFLMFSVIIAMIIPRVFDLMRSL